MSNDVSEDSPVFLEVREVLATLCGLDEGEIALDTQRESIEEWDSLQHVNLVLDLEARFGIHLDPEEIAAIASVRDIVELVQKHQGSVSAG